MNTVQKTLITLNRIFKHRQILFTRLQRLFFYVSKSPLKHRANGMSIAAIDRRGKLADTGITAESIAFLQ
ncbi:hypothetical protein D3C72_2175290 [compost metagenome]